MASPSAILSILVNANTAQATTALSKFDRQIAAVDAKTRKGIRARLGGEFNPEAFNRYTGALDKAAARTRSRDAFKAELGANFNNRAFNQYQSALEKSKAESGLASTGATKFGGAVESAGRRAVGTAAALGGVSFGLTAVAGNSLNAAAKFQQSMEQIHTQAGASQQEVNRLSGAVVKLSQTTATGPETLATGLYHLESQGLRGAKALDALKVAAEGAKVGNANLEDVTNGLGAAVVSGIKGTGGLKQAMGELNAVVGSGDMHMQDLADALGTGLLGSLKKTGISLKDVGAALAVFGDNNIRGAKAGTALASAVRLMAAPSKAAADHLHEIGITANELGDDIRNKGLVPAFEDLKKHLESAGLTATQQARVLTLAFGGKQATGVNLLLGQLDRLKTKEGDVGAGAGQLGEAWAKTQKTIQYQLDQTHATFQSLGITIGNALAPLVPSINKGAVALSKFVVQMVQGKGAGGQFAGAIKTAFETVKSIIVPVVNAVGGLGNAMKILIAAFVVSKVVAFAGALDRLLLIIANNPVGAFVIALGLLAGALGLVSGKQSKAAITAHDVADAWDAARDAARALRDSNLAVTQAKLDEINASNAQKTAQNAATTALQKYGKNSPQYQAALLAEKQANLDLRTAQNRVRDSTQDVTTAQRKAIDTYRTAIQTDQQRVQSLQQQLKVLKLTGASTDTIRGKQQQLSGAVTQLSRDQSGLNSALNGMPKSVTSKISVNVDFISNIAGAITAIGNTIGSAVSKVGSSTSSQPGHHFSGGLVTKPGYFAGEEAPQHPEIILASNPKYRQRNLGLFAKAGHMLGVPGFATGGISLVNAGREVSAVDPWTAKNAGSWAKVAATGWLKGIAPKIQAAMGAAGIPGGRVSGGGAGAYSSVLPVGRVDQGLDFTGSGPIGAILDGRVIRNTLWPGWPGTGGVVYSTAKGNVYAMEHVQASVSTGQRVKAGQVIASVLPGYPWLETGWANAAGTGPLTPYNGAADGTPMPGGIAFKKFLGFAKGGIYSKSALEGLWDSVGGNSSSANIAASIALAESSGNPNSQLNDSNGTIDRGLWQINSVHGALSTFDPTANAKAAVIISGNGKNWTPWVTYNTGAYKQFLGTPASPTLSGAASDAASVARKAPTFGKAHKADTAAAQHAAARAGAAQSAFYAAIPSQSSEAQIVSARIQNRVAASQAAGNVAGNIKALNAQVGFDRKWLAADKAKLRKVNKALSQKGLSRKQRGALLQDKLALLQEIGTIQGDIGSADASLAAYVAPTDTSAGTDPNQPLIDAMNADAAARDAQTQAIATLTATLAQNIAYMKSVGAVETSQAIKALSDVISGQIGGNYLSRSTGSAGDGSVARYGSVSRA